MMRLHFGAITSKRTSGLRMCLAWQVLLSILCANMLVSCSEVIVEPTPIPSKCDGQLQSTEDPFDSPYDLDHDNFKDGNNPDCASYYTTKADCDDTDPLIYPGAAERCNGKDDDCDGSDDASELDADNDGWVVCTPEDLSGFGPTIKGGGDCNDSVVTIHPTALETCNGLDDDCDGSTDEDPTDGETWYPDTDQDGYGAESAGQSFCTQPGGDWLDTGTDCNDSDDSIHPDALEQCDDNHDNDCDGPIDESDDEDNDGHGSCDGDCDDTDDAIFVGATETCDGVDQDCDGTPDDGATDFNTYYQDSDDDGYGGASVQACSQPDDAVTQPGDCNDAVPSIHPNAEEVCDNNIDEDCDQVVDECMPTGERPSSFADIRFASTLSSVDDAVGTRIAMAGDSDGDGLKDILIGAPSHNGGNGRVYLVHLKVGGSYPNVTIALDPSGGTQNSSVVVYDGSSSCTRAGGALAGGSNLDTYDSPDDFVVGNSAFGYSCGYLVHGEKLDDPNRMLNGDAESWSLSSTSQGYAYAHSVSMGGNFTQRVDRIGPDIAIGMPMLYYDGKYRGGVILYPGPYSSRSDFADPGPYLYGVLGNSSGDARAQLGRSVSFVGDINGDQCDDLLIGQPYASKADPNRGAVFLVYGQCDTNTPSDVFLDDAAGSKGSYVAFPVAMDGTSYSFKLGTSLGGPCNVGLGDVPDLLMGDPEESGNGAYAGAAFLVYGETLTDQTRVTVPPNNSSKVKMVALRGESTNDQAGYSVACAGDLDDNGYDDIIVGAPGWSDSEGEAMRGAVYVFYAATDGSGIGGVQNGQILLKNADLRIRGSGSDLGFGTSVAGLGDVDGDGFPDFAVGATVVDTLGHGGVYLFRGGPKTPKAP